LQKPQPTNATKNGSFVNRPPTPPGGNKSSNMVIPPWQKSTQSTSMSRSIRNTKHLADAVHKNERSSIRGGVVVMLVATLVGLWFARERGMLEGTIFGTGEAPVAQQNQADVQRNLASQSNAGTQSQQVNPLPVPVHGATVLLKANVKDFVVYANGSPVTLTYDPITDAMGFPAPVGSILKVQVLKDEYAQVDFDLEIKEAKPLVYTLNMRALPKGKVFVSTVPEATITFMAPGQIRPIVKDTPVDTLLPVGKYRMRIDSRLIDYHQEMEIEVRVDNQIQIKDLVLGAPKK
jgi:hypothetical protein